MGTSDVRGRQSALAGRLWREFKGPPRDGSVEVGYEIAECCRRRGYATAAARAMVAEAFATETVAMVLAHTLPHRNPSNRLLERLVFRFDGEVGEGDEVSWRFVLERASDDVASHPAVRQSCRDNATRTVR
jgi:RimJ/RimL family protein N-acetyltransferase